MIIKKFKPQNKIKWFILVLPVTPFVLLLFGQKFDWTIIFNFITYSVLAMTLFFRYNQKVAEIIDDKIIFYSGIGLYDPRELELSRISCVEKKVNKKLVIIYDGDRRLSLEAEKSVIDQIVKHFDK